MNIAIAGREPHPSGKTDSPAYLVSQEDAVCTLCSLVPDDQQAPTVADEDLIGVLQVSLERFHRAQCLPTPVVIRHTTDRAQVRQQHVAHEPARDCEAQSGC